HAGLKTASFLEPQPAGPAVAETSYGYFGGVKSRWAAPVGVALGVGHFEHGRLPGGSSAARATTTGVSLALHAGVGLAAPRAPESTGFEPSPFDEPRDGARSGVALGVEGAHLVQRLLDFDHPGASALASGRGLAALAELCVAALDLRAMLLWREP